GIGHGGDVPIEPPVQAPPRLALIRATIYATLLHADIHRSDDLRVRNHRAHVGDVRWWREGPALVAWNMPNGLARPPARPAVVTPIQQRRRYPPVEAARHAWVGRAGPDILGDWALMHQLPTICTGPAPQGTLLCHHHDRLVSARQKPDRWRSLLPLEMPVVSQPKDTTMCADQ